MDKFQKRIEKLRPVFEKIAANAYISAIRDGFIAAMPIILFSSVFLMIAYVPNAWGSSGQKVSRTTSCLLITTPWVC